MQPNLPPPTDKELASARDILSRLPRGFLPLPIFVELARLIPLSIVEIVPLRMKDDRIQVLLTQRPANDTHWVGMWHTPGTVVRATDELGSYRTAFDRILHEELDSVATVGGPRFVYTLLHESRRGVEDAKVFYVEVSGEPTKGRFYDIDALPPETLETTQKFIQRAIVVFAAHKASADL